MAVNVSKASLYTVLTPTIGISVSKVIIYAVLGPVFSVNCNNPSDGTVTISYNHGLSFSNGASPYLSVITNGSLPPGLSINSNGVINGRPVVAGTYAFTLKITDSNSQVAIITCSITINLNTSTYKICG
jgi:hypothetical protein